MNFHNFPQFIINANDGKIHRSSGLVSMCKFDAWRSASIGSDNLTDARQMIERTEREPKMCVHCSPESEVR